MKEMLRMILVLSLICGLSGLTLATVRQATSERIEEQVLTMFRTGPPADFTDYDNNPVKDRKTFDLPDGPITVFPAIKNGKLTGIAFERFGKGYGGPIGIMVGFSTDGTRLEGIGITTMKETPGLGARIVEPDFRTQFKGHATQNINLKNRAGISQPFPARRSLPPEQFPQSTMR